METSRPEAPAGSRKSRAGVPGVSEQLACCATTSSHPTPRACHGYPPRSDATLRSWLRHFGPRITTPAQKAGQSITRKCNAFGANKGFGCHGSPAAPPTVIADALESGVGMDFQFDVIADGWPINIGPIVDEPRESSAGWLSLERLSFAVDQFTGPATASGLSRTDRYSVTPLGAAGASRRAGTRISRRTRCRGVQHRLQGRRCPTSEHR